MILFLAVIREPVSAAQHSVGTWSTPFPILETDGRTFGLAIAGDSHGNLHVLLEHTPDLTLPYGLDYLHWNGLGWSSPVNVIVNLDGSSVGNIQMVMDSNDMIHATWTGGNNSLYYASALIENAASPHGWSEPVRIGISYPEPMGLVSGLNNTLYVAYSDAGAQGQISLVRSDDGGVTWSAPVAVAQSLPQTVPGDVRLAIDDSGRLHTTWTAYSIVIEGNEAQGVFYSHTTDPDQTSWISPVQMDDRRHGMAGVVTAGDNRVHVVWRSNVGGDGSFHTWSDDGGVTWFPPDQYEDGGGFSGVPGFYEDSLENLHYVLGPVIYNSWSDGRLGEYVDIATAEVRAAASISPGEGAAMAGTNGNRLHVIFHTDFDQIWYTTKLLSTPESLNSAPQIEPLAILQPTPSEPDNADMAPELESQLPDFPRENINRQSEIALGNTLLVPSVISIVVLIAVVIVSSHLRRRK
jgi:hypothetical protein